jgi:hypothetical protein
LNARSVRQKCAFLRGRGFESAHLAAERGEATGAALTTNAAQVAGLGRIYFDLPGYDFHDSRFEHEFFHAELGKILTSLYIRLSGVHKLITT